jgi:SAF domain
MNGKMIFLVVIVACILIFTYLIGSFLVSQLIAQRKAIVTVVLAKHDYPKGTAIKDPEDMFEKREIPSMECPPYVVSAYQDMGGRTLTRDIRKGELLLTSDLERTEDVTDLLKLDSPGPGRKYLPILVKAGKDSIRGWTHVDVIQSKSKEDGKAKTIVLHNVLVRAAVPAKLSQERLEKMQGNDGKTDWVALYVAIDVSPAEEAQLAASIEETKTSFFELRPSKENNGEK